MEQEREHHFLEPTAAILERVYSVAFDEGDWSASLSLIASSLGSTSAAMITAASRQERAVVHAYNHGPDMGEEFLTQWQSQDAWAAGARRLQVAPGQVVTGSQLVPDATLQRSAFYSDFLRKRGTERMIGSLLFSGSEPGLGLPFTHVCWYREGRRPDFDSQAVGALAHIVPHFQRAIRLRRRLSWVTREQESGSFEAMYVASIVLDPHAKILRCNDAAAAFLKLAPAGSVRFGRLRSVGSRCSPTVDAALKICTSSNPVRIAAYIGDEAHQVVACTLVALPGYGSWQQDQQEYQLLVELPRPDGRRVAQAVSGLFGLTPAEARVLGELLVGEPPAAIAQALGSAVATVRTQMSSIFSKTTTGSQSELLLLLRGMRF